MTDSEIAIVNLALLNVGTTGGLIGSFDDTSVEAQACKLLYGQVRDALFATFKWPRARRHANLSPLGGAAYNPITTYGQGEMVSFAPPTSSAVNLPETITTFVYLSLAGGNKGNQPDASPASWAQLSHAAYAYVFAVPGDVVEVQGLYKYMRNPRYDQQVPYELGNAQFLDANGNTIGPGTVLYTDTGLPYLWDWTDTSKTPVLELVYTAQVTDPKQFPPLFTEALSWALAVRLAVSILKDPDKAAKADVMAMKAIGVAKAAAQREQQKDPAPTPSHIAARFTGWRRGYRR